MYKYLNCKHTGKTAQNMKYINGIRNLIITGLIILFSGQVFGQKPVIEHINRKIAPAGVLVTISGSGFSDNANEIRVIFGAVAAKIVTATATLLEVRVPSGATYGPITVTNLTTGMTGFSRAPFMISYSGTAFDETAFSAPIDYPSTSELYDLAISDLDLDGKTDIITANRNSTSVTLLVNNSTLTTISFAASNSSIASKTVNVTCGDLNGDGKPEILLSKSGTPGDRIFVLKNQSTPGNISFAAPKYFLVNGDIARRIAVQDLDRDGKPDVVVTNQDNNTVTVLRNESSGGNINLTLAMAIVIDDPVLGPNRTTAGLAVADVNGNGYPDIIVTGFTQPNVYVVPNLSRPGTLNFGTVKELPVSGNLINIAAADINLDGKMDIIATKILQDKITVLINKYVPGSGDGNAIDFFDEAEFNVAVKPWGLDIGDINGDGKPDIIVASINDAEKKLSILENLSSNESLALQVKYITTPEVTRNVKVGDMNQDGKPDIAFTSIDSYKVTILRNKQCVTPRIFPVQPIEICNGDELVLRATPAPGTTFQWIRNDGTTDSPTGGNSPRLIETPSSGNYSYFIQATGESGNCVTTSNTTVVNVSNGVNVSTAPIIIDPAPICEESTLTLEVDPVSIVAGATYVWTLPDGNTLTGETININDITIDQSGRYIVHAESGSCKSKSDTSLVRIAKAPEITIQSSDPPVFCEGFTSALFAQSDVQFTYQWIKDGIDLPGATNSTYTAGETGNYSVHVVYMGICNVDSDPVSLISATAPVASFDLPAGSCTEQSVQFLNTSTTYPNIPVYYQWQNGDGGSTDDENPTYTYQTAGTYTVQLTVSYDDTRCANSISHTIVINESTPINIIIVGLSDVCEGDEMELGVNGTFNSYSWSTGASSSTIKVNASGTYSVEVENANQCKSSDTMDIVLNPIPEITTIPENPEITAGESVQLEASGAVDYVWTPADGLSATDIYNPVATPASTISYTVSGTSIDNCTGTAEITVRVMPLIVELGPAKVFSPNGDLINDTWKIEKIENYPEYLVTIHNRAGSKVYETAAYSGNEWDGTSNGREMAESVYYFIISDGGVKIKSGSVTLIR